VIALKSLIFLTLVPGVIAGLIPFGLLQTGPRIQTGLFSYLAFPLWFVGLATLLWSFLEFLQKGKGTPAPIDPPKELVVSGLYRHVRNPMYVGVFLMLVGHFLWLGYWYLLVYAGLFCIPVFLFVTFYEEPNLKRRFGAAYEDYMKKVPRWIPKIG